MTMRRDDGVVLSFPRNYPIFSQLNVFYYFPVTLKFNWSIPSKVYPNALPNFTFHFRKKKKEKIESQKHLKSITMINRRNEIRKEKERREEKKNRLGR